MLLEPVTPDPPRPVGRALMTQSWLDLAFLHWEADPEEVALLLPPGTVPDLFEGRAYVGLVPFRMHRVGWFSLPGVPYFGTFPETNVRLYSVDGTGRRGVVFRTLDASRLVPVLAARTGFRLPYVWSKMTIRTEGEVTVYESRRRWPGPEYPTSRIAVRRGAPIREPSDLEHFLTARWGLHTVIAGRLRFIPNEHPRWPLHRAELVECDEDLVENAGLTVGGGPVSVLWTPGVAVRFGRPMTVSS
ncbi:YqjF family protein [Glycomyces mayteni]|uniref:YqjF family protein n=1 Tax=Glycomyces mayteni TaxID=543887 RepID=A0ABW2D3L8_9ACTN|nr:DUF2071 domain-containing protein [Glycomyces mayteni]